MNSIINRTIEVYTGKNESFDRIKFYGEDTLNHPDIVRHLNKSSDEVLIDAANGYVEVSPPLNPEGMQKLVETVFESYPIDIVQLYDRRGEEPYSPPAIYPECRTYN